ncbi:MAG: hypothetical protein U0X73_17145 [Thermoanaerobaculia bacterium]
MSLPKLRLMVLVVLGFAVLGSPLLGVAHNAPEGPRNPSLISGSIEAAYAADDCLTFSYRVTVVTSVGVGNENFTLQLWDDGNNFDNIPLSAPADGLEHVITGTYTLTQPPATAAPGIGLILVDANLGFVDVIDPFVCTRGWVAIPTLDVRGAIALVALLAVVGALVLRRRRANA